MRVRDLAEPLLIAVGDGDDRAVHYAVSGGSGMLCGHEADYMPHVYEHEDSAPEWIYTDDVCGECVRNAAGLLRWWHPRAKLPEWAL